MSDDRELFDGRKGRSSSVSVQKAITLVLEVFQQDPAKFYPYTSKFDDVLRGRDKLTEREARGLALFNDPKKGNCASRRRVRTSSAFLETLSDRN